MAVVAVWTGHEARALRIGLRMTVEAFAEYLGVAVRTVARWEAQGSKIVPVPVAQEALDTALERATPTQQSRFDLLLSRGLAPCAGSSGESGERGATDGPDRRREGERSILEAAACQSEGEDVNRRQVLVDLGMLGLAVPLAGVEAVRHGLAAAFGDEHAADIDEWDEIAHEYGRAFYAIPADRLIRDLTADLSVLSLCLERTDANIQRSLARVGGQLAAISAMAWASAGEARHASRWWRTARQLADRSGDIEARTWVRGWEVANGLYEQRSVPAILDQAAEAISIAGPLPCAGAAGLYAGLAQTLAVAGRADEALAALKHVADMTDQLPAQVVAAEDSMFGWPEVRLRHTESYVHTWLGDTSRAYAAQERALRLYPASLARERAAMLLHRAACMIRDGDVSGGLAYAGHVLDSLPTEHHTELVYAIGRASLQVMPVQERVRPEAVELRARLAFPPAGRKDQ